MKKILIMFFSLLLFIGCDKEETVPEEEIPNTPPLSFELISPVSLEETDIIDITFEWGEATDPDGDVVTYDLYIRRATSSAIKIAEDLPHPTYTWENKSAFNTVFDWYVVAKDGKPQGETTSPESSFTTRKMQLQQILANGSPNSFPDRFGYTGMYFNNIFYIVGGRWEGEFGDVWSSASLGTNWSLEADLSSQTAGSFARYAHTSVIFNNRMYIIGGRQGGEPIEELFVTENGRDWDDVQYPGSFGPRYEHSSVVFNDRIWVIGGYNNDTFLGDVVSWSGNPGEEWRVDASGSQTPFNGIRGHSSVTYDGRIWIIGGTESGGYVDHVWSSDDGRNWSPAASLPRGSAYHKSVVFDTKIWVIGGLTASGASNHLYYYEDGEWHHYDLPEEITALYNHDIVAVNEGGPDDGIYIFGSFNGLAYFNNVWKLH